MGLKFAIALSGRGSNMLALHDVIAAMPDKARCVCVIADKDCLGLEKAKERGLEAHHVSYKELGKDAAEAQIIARLQEHQIDFLLLAGFMRILSPTFVEAFPQKIINIHPSLLPKYKGVETHRRALEAGDAHHGATVHFVTAELDDGPILCQAAIPIQPDDTEDTLAARLLPAEHWLYQTVVRALIKGDLTEENGTYHWKTAPHCDVSDVIVTDCPIAR